MSGADPILREIRAILEHSIGLHDRLSKRHPDDHGTNALSTRLIEAARELETALARAPPAAGKQAPLPSAVQGAPAGDPAPAGSPARRATAPTTPVPAAAPTVEGPRRPPDRSRQTARVEEPQEPREPDEEPDVRLARSLSRLCRIIEEDRLVVDQTDSRFAAKAADALEGLSSAERKGEKGTRLLVACVHAMDVLDRDYRAPGYERLAEAAASLRRSFAELLKDSRGVRFVPDPAEGDSFSGLGEAKRLKFPSEKPEGEVLMLFKRGTEHPGGKEPPELLVSLGRTTPVFEFARRFGAALLRPVDLPAKTRQERAAAAKEVRQKYLRQLVDADGDREATVLRYLANLVQPLNRDGSLKELVAPILSMLKDRGFSPITASIGSDFGESFSTSKYERKKVPSNEPLGRIVEVIQIGFTNRDGVPVQKAVIGVSGGPG
jgi:hypothetical protein